MGLRPVVGQPIYGNAASFNGTSQYFSRTFVTDESGDITFAMWVNPTSYQGASTFFFNNGANNANGTGMFLTSAGLFQMNHHFRANLNSGSTLSLGTWYHVGLTKSGGTTQLWVNGSTAGGTTATTPNNAGSFSALGCSQDSGGTPSAFFSGKVDDARIYTRAISGAEMTALYNYGLNINNPDISSANLAAWWKLDETSGNAADSSGNARTFTNNGVTPYVTGKVQLSNIPARTAVSSPARSASPARTIAPI